MSKHIKIYEADFVIVGMGAAGAIMARILSDHGYNVIGIEGGGNYDDDPLICDSTNAPSLEMMYTWKFFYNQETEPNDDIVLSSGENLVLNYTTGRLLGGGSSINGMQYVRGTDNYWNKWGDINGSRWNAKSALKGYKELENFVGVKGEYNHIVHGYKGNMEIRQAPVVETSMALKFATALAKSTSSSVISDYNNPETPIGTFTRWSLFQQPDGKRASSSTNWLQDVVNKDGKSINSKNKIRILQNTTVNKVLFCKHEAIGVEAIRNGKTIIIKSKYETILCAGIHSNEILQRSGIGNKTLLKSLKIPVIFDNPNVGVGSKNHLINAAIFSANENDLPGTGDDPNAIYVGGGFLPTPESENKNERGFQWIGGFLPEPGSLAVVFYNLNPQSVGVDKIQDKDPLRVSAVNEHLLSEPIDLQNIVDVYQQQILALNDEFNLNYPGYSLMEPSVEIINDTDALKKYIKDNLDHTHHWTGTCKMDDINKGGVVDNKGRVHGVKYLRVADISIAPIQPDGNTAGPAMFVGYNITKQILKRYSK